MARLRSPHFGTLWLDRLLKEPDGGDRSLNGVYKGALPVRIIAPALGGADLSAGREPPAPGQLWRRGPQVVRILEATALTIVFLELTEPGNRRAVRRCDFLRSARRKAD